MKRHLLILLILIWPGVAFGTAISGGETYNFEGSIGVDVREYPDTYGGEVVHNVDGSWDGSDCAEIIPPNNAQGGDNGIYAALGDFTGFDWATINVSFAIKVGTTYNSTSVNSGGGHLNKFLDVFGATDRTTLLTLRRWDPVYEWCVLGDLDEYYHYDGDTTGSTTGGYNGAILFDDGASGLGLGDEDYAGTWLWVNFVATQTTLSLYIYDRDGNYSGLYYSVSYTAPENHTSFYIGGYYNSTHTEDAGNHILIDNLHVTNDSTPHTVPTGFVGGEPPVEQAAFGVGNSGTAVGFGNSGTPLTVAD